MKDVDFLLAGGEIFALVVYAQLLLENARLYKLDNDLLDEIFDFMVRDMSRYAMDLHSKPMTSARQMEHCLKIVRRPEPDAERYTRVWQTHVEPMSGAYEMPR
jgi:acyl-CoA dehydrogenase